MTKLSIKGFCISTDTKPVMDRQIGFTLVEMLVSIVLSSIIFVSAYQVISNLVQYQVRSRAHQEAQIDQLLLRNILSNIIEESIYENELFSGGQNDPLFLGEPNSLRLVSRAYSKHYDKPGHRVYQIYQREDQIYLSYRRYDRDYDSNHKFEMSTGLKIKDIEFEYFDDKDWSDDWTNEDSIPRYIRVKLELPGSEVIQWVRATSQR